MLIIEETGECVGGIYGEYLYFSFNFSVNLQLLQKVILQPFPPISGFPSLLKLLTLGPKASITFKISLSFTPHLIVCSLCVWPFPYLLSFSSCQYASCWNLFYPLPACPTCGHLIALLEMWPRLYHSPGQKPLSAPLSHLSFSAIYIKWPVLHEILLEAVFLEIRSDLYWHIVYHFVDICSNDLVLILCCTVLVSPLPTQLVYVVWWQRLYFPSTIVFESLECLEYSRRPSKNALSWIQCVCVPSLFIQSSAVRWSERETHCPCDRHCETAQKLRCSWH